MGDLARQLRPPPPVSLDKLFSWVLDRLAEAIVSRLKLQEPQPPDPNWGMVSQRTLPAWIHPVAYVRACRSGEIDGARLWRKQWLASREAVERWVLVEQPANDNDPEPVDPESDEAVLAEAGLSVKVTGARPSR